MVVVSVTEGDDIVLKHPVIFKTADLAVIHKKDLAEAVFASAEKMEHDVRELNATVPILTTSIHDPASMDQWFSMISSSVEALKKG